MDKLIKYLVNISILMFIFLNILLHLFKHYFIIIKWYFYLFFNFLSIFNFLT